MDETIKIVHIG